MKKLATAVAPYLLSLGAALAVALPLVRINPSRTQSSTDLMLGHFLITWSPLLTAVALALGLLLAAAALRSLESKLAKLALVLPVGLLVVAAVAARGNFYERMFAPLPKPGYVGAADAEFLSDHDLVLGVEVQGQAAAYPVGMVAYHHIVNDRLRDEPFVVTY